MSIFAKNSGFPCFEKLLGKIASVERYRELRADGVFEFPPLRGELEFDTGTLSPLEAARRVSAVLSDG